MFREYRPGAPLAPYIETYWASDGKPDSRKAMRILPDGCVDIIINLREGDGGFVPFVPHIVGTMTTFADLSEAGGIRMMGMRFRPCAIAAFTRVPINEFTDNRVDTRLFESLFDDFNSEKFYETGGTESRISFIDSWLSGKLGRLFDTDGLVIRAVEYIRKTRGWLPISELMKEVCLCQRQFERRFKAATGVTPKTFSAITRFEHTGEYLRRHPETSLSAVAAVCGYCDHAHLIHDFKRFGGTLPRNSY